MKVAIQGSRSSGSGKTTISMEFYNDNGIVMGLESVASRASQNFVKYMQVKADEIEAYMKQNHPWQNRTGRAERGLHTSVEDVVVGGQALVQIGLLHDEGTWYWRHLEYGMGRRFSIIEPTQRIYGPKLLTELNLSELYRFTGNPKK